jgi:hypothetical protein
MHFRAFLFVSGLLAVIAVAARGRQPLHAAWDHPDYVDRRMKLGRIIHKQPCARLTDVLGSFHASAFLNGTDIPRALLASKTLRWHVACNPAEVRSVMEITIVDGAAYPPPSRVFIFMIDDEKLINATGCGGTAYDPTVCDGETHLPPLDQAEVSRLTEYAHDNNLQLAGGRRFMDLADHVRDVQEKCQVKLYADSPVCRNGVMRLMRLADAVREHGGVAVPEHYRPRSEL